MTLSEYEQIVGAWCEAPSGPGWRNRLVWVCIRDGATGTHRVDAIQPEDQDEEMVLIFRFCLVASDALNAAVQNWKPRRASKRARR